MRAQTGRPESSWCSMRGAGRSERESTPYGSHQELMDAAGLLRDCVAYGPKPRGEHKGDAASMVGK
jgi:hypothetical protein